MARLAKFRSPTYRTEREESGGSGAEGSSSLAQPPPSKVMPRLKGSEYESVPGTTTMLRGASSTTLLRGVLVGHGIRCRNRVAVGHGISSRSHMATLGQGVGTIGRNGALPALVNKLHQVTLTAAQSPGRRMNLDLSQSYIERIREEVSLSYQEGQRAMTQMAELLTMSLTRGEEHECRSTVRAELWKSSVGDDEDMDKMQFSLSESVDLALVRGGCGSLELAQSQLRGLVVNACGEWRGARVVDHSVDLDVLHANEHGMMKVVALARPSTELWRLIVDSMFGIDYPELGAECQGLDEEEDFAGMYQIQVLVETDEQAEAMYQQLGRLEFTDTHLRELGVEGASDTRKLELVSRTDSTRTTQVVWRGTGMRIQVETLNQHLMASELSIMAERAKERTRREDLLNKLESRAPIFRFSRDLLRWTVSEDSALTPPPSVTECRHVTVKLSP